MICPLLSYQSRFEQCQAGRCAWWDEIRQCCAVITPCIAGVVNVGAKARLDSDAEHSGGAQE